MTKSDKNYADPDDGGRLAELQREVGVPEPFDLSDYGLPIMIPPPTRRQMREIRKFRRDNPVDAEGFDPEAFEDGMNRLIIGDSFDKIETHFEDLPAKLWDVFAERIGQQFFGPGASDVEGKSPDSSTSSTGTGMS